GSTQIGSRSHVFESKLPEPCVQLHPRYAELPGCSDLVAIGLPHSAFNRVLLECVQIGDVRQRNILPRSQREVPGVDERSIADDEGALEHVAQLTDIAGPFVTAQ